MYEFLYSHTCVHSRTYVYRFPALLLLPLTVLFSSWNSNVYVCINCYIVLHVCINFHIIIDFCVPIAVYTTTWVYPFPCRNIFVCGADWYGVATISRLLKMIGLFCKRAIQNRRYSVKETCNFKESTNCSHPICRTTCVCI